MPENTVTMKYIKNTGDLNEVLSLLAVIVQKLCWQVRFTYGNELLVEIGEQVSHLRVRDGKKTLKKKGEFIIASCGTDWILMKDGQIEANSSENRDVLLEKLSGLVGNLIVRIEVDFPKLALTVFVEGDYALSITPQAEDDKIDLPYWQVFFTATRRLLEVGPGPVFTLIEEIQNPDPG